MGRLADAWRVLTGRSEVKARRDRPARAPISYGSRGGTGFYGLSGTGATPWPGGAKANYTALAGDLSACSVVAICLAWIRDNLPSARLQVGSFDAEHQFQPDESNGLALLFAGRPNPLHTWRQTWGATSDCYKIDGNAYWIKARDGYDLTRELYWVPNDWIRIITDEYGFISHYEYRPDGVAGEVLPADRVIHFRDGIDPCNPVMGLSRLKRTIRSIVGLNAGETYTAAILRNFGVSGGLLFPPDGSLGWDDDTRLGAVRSVRSATTGENAGDFFAFSQPMRLEQPGRSPEDLMLDRILDRPEAIVCAALGVNALVTGLPASDGTRTYSNLAEASRLAWENGLIPMQDAFAEIVRDNLAVDYDLPGETVVRWDRSQVEALNEQADARAARARALFEATLYDRNTSLTVCGFDPVEGPEGERYYGDPSPMAEQQQREAMERETELAREQAANEGADADADMDTDTDTEDENDSAFSRNGFSRGGSTQ